jgi:hypothetical protein
MHKKNPIGTCMKRNFLLSILAMVCMTNAMNFLDFNNDIMNCVIQSIDPAENAKLKKIKDFYSEKVTKIYVADLETDTDKNNLHLCSTLVKPICYLSCDVLNFALVNKHMLSRVINFCDAYVSQLYKIYLEKTLKVLPDENKKLINLYGRDLVKFYSDQKILLFCAPFAYELNGNEEKGSLTVYFNSRGKFNFFAAGLPNKIDILTKEKIWDLLELCLKNSTNVKQCGLREICKLKIEEWIKFFKDQIKNNNKARIEGYGNCKTGTKAEIPFNDKFRLTPTLFFTLCELKCVIKQAQEKTE